MCRAVVVETRDVTDWASWITAWVSQDGNYPNFVRGQHLEVAVEFYVSDGLAKGMTNSLAQPVMRTAGISSTLPSSPFSSRSG
jgi:hypothetical protein